MIADEAVRVGVGRIDSDRLFERHQAQTDLVLVDVVDVFDRSTGATNAVVQPT